jgi:hypothetical protein
MAGPLSTCMHLIILGNALLYDHPLNACSCSGVADGLCVCASRGFKISISGYKLSAVTAQLNLSRKKEMLPYAGVRHMA